jgi:hypothetical protein
MGAKNPLQVVTDRLNGEIRQLKAELLEERTLSGILSQSSRDKIAKLEQDLSDERHQHAETKAEAARRVSTLSQMLSDAYAGGRWS